jgi:putative transposase
MPYTVMYYHMIWTTKYRQKTISSALESSIIAAIQDKSEQLSSPIHAINNAYDHIHIAVSIAPSIAVAHWVGQTKAFSSYIVNREFKNLESDFHWQGGYGSKTFGEKALSYVSNYIIKQKEHHANNHLDAYLEEVPED